MNTLPTLIHAASDDLANEEFLRSHDIYTSLADLGPRIWGFVYQCRHGHYHIVASAWLNEEERRRLFWHEAWHIIEDFPRMPYVIGLDEQWSVRERKADSVAMEVVGHDGQETGRLRREKL